MIVLQISEADP